MTPDSIERARTLIAQPDIETVTFDLFDTLILRRSTTPDGVFERVLAHAPLPDRYRSLIDSFVQHRTLAEYKARTKAIKVGRGEVSIDEIYAQLPAHVFGIDRAVCELLPAAEWQAERDLCLINPAIVALAAEAHRRGRRVGFISDTYWPRARLVELLHALQPDLPIDFLYASCEAGVAKSFGLFNIVRDAETIDPARWVHMGDNAVADVAVPSAMGIQTIHYPQHPAWLADPVRREDSFVRISRLRRPDFSQKLDDGIRVMRRLTASRLDGAGVAHATGIAVFGPVFTAFQRFVENRVKAVAAPGRVVKVAFLARDAFLPMRIWQAAGAGDASYVEINRRIALVGCSDRAEPLQDLFSMMRILDQAAVENFLKIEVPAVTDFFAGQKDGMATGRSFAAEIPNLLDDQRLADVSRAMRRNMLEHLRKAIPDFDTCTDLVIVDLGYSGTIQRALRGIFDIEAIGKRIHGVYLATVDDMFATLPDGDTVCGLIDDTIMTPFTKRMLLRNVAVVEQCCSAPVGSVLDYIDGEVVREDDVRPRDLIERAFDVQESCVAFFDAYREAVSGLGIDPLDGGDTSRLWAAAILSRLLMLPSREERQFFGPLLQDVNLGSRTLVPMIDGGFVEAMMDTMPFPMVCVAREPPMWLGGSIGEVLPAAGYIYAMMGEGLAPLDLVGDETLGAISVGIIKDGVAVPLSVTAHRTGFGDIRLRIPVPRTHQDGKVAIALDGFLAQGLIKNLMLQRGADVGGAMLAGSMDPIPVDLVEGLRAGLCGPYFYARDAKAYLLIPVEQSTETVAVLTVVLTPVFISPAAPKPHETAKPAAAFSPMGTEPLDA